MSQFSNEEEKDCRIYEYTSAANPDMTGIPVRGFDAELHCTGPTRLIPFDLSDELKISSPATSPNLLAHFIRICPSDSIQTQADATSQAFYIIRGTGTSLVDDVEIIWSTGDLFVVPFIPTPIIHSATSDSAIYWITDEPLLRYLGVTPSRKKFHLTIFRKERMLAEIETIKHQPGAEHRNRLGILLGNRITENNTKTLTHVLWSLLNVLPPNDAQRPHRHNSVALDLCVFSPSGADVINTPGNGVYTLMGPELDEDGWVKNPIRMNWTTGSVFVTPPGWWHSHHNETSIPAMVFPVQDAGLLTHQRILDIQFSVGPSPSSSSYSST